MSIQRDPDPTSPHEADRPPSGVRTGASGGPTGSSVSINNLLSQILSASEAPPVRSEDAAIHAGLREVARSLQGEEFSLDPVLLDLIRVITSRLQGLSADRRTALDRSVATTLYEDTESRLRLEKLWTKLSGPRGNAE